jgi:hypothetical protein
MKKSIPYKHSHRADAAVTVVGLVGALVCFALFYVDFTRTLTKNAPVAATVAQQTRTAQRHFGDRVLWDRLRPRAPLYRGDVIRTAPRSRVSLQFEKLV